MPLPNSPAINWMDEYRRGYRNQITDEAKVKYLCMLKERAQRQADKPAYSALLELVDIWVKEPYKA